MRSREKGFWDICARVDRLIIVAAWNKLDHQYRVYGIHAKVKRMLTYLKRKHLTCPGTVK